MIHGVRSQTEAHRWAGDRATARGGRVNGKRCTHEFELRPAVEAIVSRSGNLFADGRCSEAIPQFLSAADVGKLVPYGEEDAQGEASEGGVGREGGCEKAGGSGGGSGGRGAPVVSHAPRSCSRQERSEG